MKHLTVFSSLLVLSVGLSATLANAEAIPGENKILFSCESVDSKTGEARPTPYIIGPVEYTSFTNTGELVLRVTRPRAPLGRTYRVAWVPYTLGNKTEKPVQFTTINFSKATSDIGERLTMAQILNTFLETPANARQNFAAKIQSVEIRASSCRMTHATNSPEGVPSEAVRVNVQFKDQSPEQDVTLAEFISQLNL
jgi:hypothetical protein